MPISPKDVFETDKTTKFVTSVIKEVDSKLSNTEWVKDWACGTEKDPYYVIVMVGSLTAADKKHLIETYSQAGWGQVIVENSSDKGERPGLCSVQLHRFSKSTLELMVSGADGG